MLVSRPQGLSITRKRVAIQCQLLSRCGGGLPAAVLPVADRLRDIAVVVTADPPEAAHTADVIPVRSRGPITSSTRILCETGVRLVHTHGLWSGLSASALAWRRRTGGATIVSPHGMLDSWALANGRLKKALALRLVERAHMNGSAIVHALNLPEAEAIRAAGITAPIAIVPNGVDPAPSIAPPPPAWIDRPTLLFLGRLHEKKGITVLIDAWSQASKGLPGWQLAVAGWDDGPNEFREHAARSGAPIVFPGPLFGEEKTAAYAHCAAFVLPSYSEGLPMTVLEAWSHGKPVLMTDACNLPEGFAVEAAARITTDPRNLAEDIAHYLLNPAFTERAGEAGRRLVSRQFSWDAISQRFKALYAFALGEAECTEDLWRPEEQRHFA